MVTQQQIGSCLFQPMVCDTSKSFALASDGYQLHKYNNVNRVPKVPTLFVLPFISFLNSFTHFNILLQYKDNSLMKLLSSVWIPWIKGTKTQGFPYSAISLERTTSKPEKPTEQMKQVTTPSFCSVCPQEDGLPQSQHSLNMTSSQVF